MTDDANFEDRLRATFREEAAELTRRQDRASSDDAVRSAALVDEFDDHGPDANRRMLVPLLAAAVVLIAGIAGVFSLARSADDSIVPVAATQPRPLVTATPTPTPTITVVPTLVATPEPSAAGGGIDEEPFFHTVQPGDLLGGIAVRYNVTLDAILRANPDLNPNVLFVGERILIPGATRLAVELPPSTPVEAAPATAVPGEAPPTVTPTPTRPPLPTAVPAAVEVEPAPTSTGFIVTEPLCLISDTAWLPSGTCGIEVIGPVQGDSHVPVQVTDDAGRVDAGFVPLDALTAGEALPAVPYQPGLLEDSWCVVDIFSPDTLNVRQGPFTDREIVGELVEGQCGIYRTFGERGISFGGWTPVSVDVPGGTPLTGWAASRYLRPDVERVPSGVPMQTISVRVVSFDPQLSIPAIEEFELFDGRVQLGSPDRFGVIEIPAATDPLVVGASAPVDGDPFCAWSGALGPTDSDGYHLLRVAMLCA